MRSKGGEDMFSIITHNKNKYMEIKKFIPALRMVEMEYPEIQADTLEEVVMFALQYLRPRIEGDYIIDDSGLFIDALNGFPGVYSAYVFKTIGNDGILRLLRGVENRSATFKTVIGLHYQGENFLFTGICRGSIIYEMRGNNGFGYDPIFVPEGFTRTFAEMSTSEKNAVSHRGNAIKKMVEFLKERDAI